MARNGQELAQRWGVKVDHALYSTQGDWYHQLKRFPGALFDAHGYIIFETAEAFQLCPWLRIRQDVNVKTGIRSIKNIPGYVRVVIGGKEIARHELSSTTYERATTAREGKPFDVILTRYERDPANRDACLAHYGFACSVCGMTFDNRYGEIGKGFIHVHHLDQLAQGGERDVDPIIDLRPVCPNCHAMLHTAKPPLSIEALKAMLQPSRQGSAEVRVEK